MYILYIAHVFAKMGRSLRWAIIIIITIIVASQGVKPQAIRCSTYQHLDSDIPNSSPFILGSTGTCKEQELPIESKQYLLAALCLFSPN